MRGEPLKQGAWKAACCMACKAGGVGMGHICIPKSWSLCCFSPCSRTCHHCRMYEQPAAVPGDRFEMGPGELINYVSGQVFPCNTERCSLVLTAEAWQRLCSGCRWRCGLATLLNSERMCDQVAHLAI